MLTFKQMIIDLNNRRNFTFSRFGDGEFNCILGVNGENTDGHLYYSDLGESLKRVIKSKPSYYMGLQNMVKRIRGDQDEFKELTKGIHWHDADIIHHQSIKYGLDDLFTVLKSREVILVGNPDIQMNGYLSLTEKIDIQKENAWLDYYVTFNEIQKTIEENDVILYCAGMMTEVLMDDLFNIYKNEITQIDIGSAFDPYNGIISRSYHKHLKL